MGLEHEFYLITQDEYEEMLFDGSYLPSINPAMNYKKGFGLNNYGITMFDKEGAEVIFKWFNYFKTYW